MRLISHNIILLLALLCSQQLYGQLQLRISTGTNDSKIINILPKQTSYKNAFAVETALNKSLTTLYDNGYLAASFDSIIIDSTTYFTHFVLGKQIKWANLKKGNINEEYISQSGYREKLYNNKIFNYQQSAKLLQKLLTYYTNNGYPFAKIKLDSIQFTENKVTAKLKAITGQAYKIDSIQIVGNAKVSKKYLYNLLNIEPDSPFSDKEFTSIDKKLKQISFLTVTKASEINFYENTATIVVYIDSKKTNQVDGIIGFLPNNNQTGELLITGEAKLKLNNAFKRGSLIDVHWKKLQALTQDLKTKANYPFLFGSQFGIDGEFNLYKRDTSYVNINQKLALQYLLQGNSYLQGFVTSRRTNPIDTNLINIKKNTYLGYGIGLKNSVVDYVLNPTTGYDFEIATSIGNKTTDSQPNSTQINWKTTVNKFTPIFKQSSVLKTSIQAAQIRNTSTTLIQSELHRIGGLKTLRGFDEEAIFANLYTIATIEYRYLLDQHSYLSLFYDAAYFEEETTSATTNTFANGFGAGISFETKSGIFSLNYALGKIAGNDLLVKNAKIHFGIASYF